VYVVVWPGETVGGTNNATIAFPTRDDPKAVATGLVDPLEVATGVLYDVDFYDSPCYQGLWNDNSNNHKPNWGDNKIDGDDKGPLYDITPATGPRSQYPFATEQNYSYWDWILAGLRRVL
jgi:hypothetical protein